MPLESLSLAQKRAALGASPHADSNAWRRRFVSASTPTVEPRRWADRPRVRLRAEAAGAHDLLLECGSSLANAMLLPRGARLTLLCLRDHTTSRGCYGQLLATRFTQARARWPVRPRPDSTGGDERRACSLDLT